MTFSDSSSSVRVVSSLRSGETSRCDPEVGSSGASSGPPSPVDARVLRDLEVMKLDHDLDTTVTEGSLAVIREQYSIPIEYGLHVLQPGQRPYSLDAPGMCISVDALEVAPNSWRYLVVFLGECRGAGIIPTRDLFMACFRLCKSQGGYYLTARVGFRVSGAPSNNKGWKSRYLFVSGLVWGFRLDWLAHPIDNASLYLSEEETILVDKLKGILSSSRAIKEMAELWLVEAGLSPASRDRIDLGDLCRMPKVTSSKVPPTRPTAREVGASPAREAPKASLKRPVVTPTEQIEDAARRHKKVKVLTKRHKSHLDEGESHSRSKGKEPAAPSEEPEAPAVAKAEERASELQEELEKTKRERGEELLRREASEKELHEVRSHLGDAQRLLKEARVRVRKMDDELLHAMKARESARAELPKQSVIQYTESLGFKEGLKRMGRVTYE
ncbi:hypothetical protein BHE74_00016484 [Ensete ventricosum]|nr:hypothetical protein BHE74_00016484 [Ensete ventricosum]